MNAVTKVKDMAFAVTETASIDATSSSMRAGGAYSIDDPYCPATRLYCRRGGAHRRYRCPVEAQRIATGFCHRFQPRPPPLVNSVTGTRRPSFSRSNHQQFYACNRARTVDNRAR